MITLSELWTYPLKSAKGISLQTSIISSYGLEHDRTFMLVDDNGLFISQRKFPILATIHCHLHYAKNNQAFFIFKQSQKKPISVDPLQFNKQLKVTVWQDTFIANAFSNNVNQWFSDVLNTSCQLVSMRQGIKRQVDLDYAKKGDITAFSDGFPLLIISQASLDDLNSRLTEKVLINRFRPNLVVNGCEAFEEDTWKKIKISNTIFDVVKPCSRCVIPNTNQETGIRTTEPIKTLAKYRKNLFGLANNKIYFGQNIIQQSQGEIQLGAPLTVLETI